MTAGLVKITVNHDGCEQVLAEVADLVREVGTLLRRHVNASDATISFELPQDHGKLLVALQAGSAFIGLDTHDGIYQYVADDAATGKRQSLIGGQPTAIDARYVLPVAEAIGLLTAWLAGSAPLGELAWERQEPRTTAWCDFHICLSWADAGRRAGGVLRRQGRLSHRG